MGLYKHIQILYKQPKKNLKELYKKRLIEFRRSPTIVRIEKPTRLDRARSLGYKAKQGYIVVRVKLSITKRKRPQIKHGRRPKHHRIKKVVGKSYQWIAEERATRRYKNCEVIGSYEIAKDGIYKWYEIILADVVIVSRYKEMSWLKNSRGRALRGLTASGKRSRGILTNKGQGAEKLRPSLRAHRRRGK